MKHAILGGGNIGTLMGAELAAKGHEVSIVTSDPLPWSNSIDILDQNEELLVADCPINATSNLAQAVTSAQYIWITYPTYLFDETAAKLSPLLSKGQRIGVIPGACAEFFFSGLVEKGCTLFGFQRVHSVARIVKRGHSVAMLGRKPSLQIASIPSNEASDIASQVESFFDIPTEALPNYLNLTLVPSNPILHTSRIATMFHDWKQGDTYPRNYLFYEEWTDDASCLMLECDNELQQLCEILPLDLSAVISLRKHYESNTPEAMTQKISHIPAFKGLSSPMTKLTEDMWVPDFKSRYFRADFSYGLEAIRQIADLAGVDTPGMDQILDWYYRTSGEQRAFTVNAKNLEQLIDAY
ncbi:NAD/NADP octopine/nopaline dehydrogenase family protein [Adlercreutzia muris]|uniref:NAD/NADP octopine/nopaline dehydrogenase family protein n=1 Tax=Adlercreutzia muris TaxID=1796610 RepID=UPI001F5A9629|nr:NAD/NADP-dependent octopine/nopaline dehydrogenase family protein [Adlercreutzia muris]